MERQLKTNSVSISDIEWIKAGEIRYGKDTNNWKFRCPVCEEIFTISDWNKKTFSRAPIPIQDCPTACDDSADRCFWFGFGTSNPVHVHLSNSFGFLPTCLFDFADKPLLCEGV